jgi:hypothetical protein
MLIAGSLRIETVEGSRPRFAVEARRDNFGKIVAHWVFDRDRATWWNDVATKASRHLIASCRIVSRGPTKFSKRMGSRVVWHTSLIRVHARYLRLIQLDLAYKHAKASAARGRLSCVLGMLSSLEVKVLRPT